MGNDFRAFFSIPVLANLAGGLVSPARPVDAEVEQLNTHLMSAFSPSEQITAQMRMDMIIIMSISNAFSLSDGCSDGAFAGGGEVYKGACSNNLLEWKVCNNSCRMIVVGVEDEVICFVLMGLVFRRFLVREVTSVVYLYGKYLGIVWTAFLGLINT